MNIDERSAAYGGWQFVGTYVGMITGAWCSVIMKQHVGCGWVGVGAPGVAGGGGRWVVGGGWWVVGGGWRVASNACVVGGGEGAMGRLGVGVVGSAAQGVRQRAMGAGRPCSLRQGGNGGWVCVAVSVHQRRGAARHTQVLVRPYHSITLHNTHSPVFWVRSYHPRHRAPV